MMTKQRKAALKGQEKRRLNTVKYIRLDRVLKRDMGRSALHYKFTKRGTPRLEFYGLKIWDEWE